MFGKNLPVDDEVEIKFLDKELFTKLAKFDNSIDIGMIDIQTYDFVTGWKIFYRDHSALSDILTIDFVKSFIAGQNISKDELEKIKVCLLIGDKEFETLPLKDCLTTEIVKGNSTFTLCMGNWYLVEKDYEKALNSSIAQFAFSSLKLPNFDPDIHFKYKKKIKISSENKYNEIASKKIDALLMDAQFVYVDKSKIEACDILTKDRNLVHVKRGSGFSSLSHLTSQANISTKLIFESAVFRKKLAEVIKKQKNSQDYVGLFSDRSAPPSSEITVTLVVIVDRRINSLNELTIQSKECLRNYIEMNNNLKLHPHIQPYIMFVETVPKAADISQAADQAGKGKGNKSLKSQSR